MAGYDTKRIRADIGAWVLQSNPTGVFDSLAEMRERDLMSNPSGLCANMTLCQSIGANGASPLRAAS